MDNILLYALLAVMLVGMYLFYIRPQKKAVQDKSKRLAKLSPGDRIITIGGLYAAVESIQEEDILLRMEPGGGLQRVSPHAISVFPEDFQRSIEAQKQREQMSRKKK